MTKSENILCYETHDKISLYEYIKGNYRQGINNKPNINSNFFGHFYFKSLFSFIKTKNNK